MTSVKAVPRAEEIQAPLLMGLLLRQVAGVFASEDWGGLRQSHVRVISSVPDEGVSVTELAERVGMTKQGCGQFVTQLVESGHLRVARDRGDRRIRVVRRTARGERFIATVTARVLELEHDWADQVGERRYRTFRKVLEELALTSAR
jgi:DNA-binding MarR family transcriptional regulator